MPALICPNCCSTSEVKQRPYIIIIGFFTLIVGIIDVSDSLVSLISFISYRLSLYLSISLLSTRAVACLHRNSLRSTDKLPLWRVVVCDGRGASSCILRVFSEEVRYVLRRISFTSLRV